MYLFWSSLSSGALTKAAEIAGDLLPILAVVFGIGIGERVLFVVRRMVSR